MVRSRLGDHQAPRPLADVSAIMKCTRCPSPAREGRKKCLDCVEKQREADQKWRQANLEKRREADRKWRQANLEKKREADRKYYHANREKSREATRKRRNNFPKYPCPGYCEICLAPVVDGGKPMACSDHNHQTKKWRGWLCSYCNTTLGALENLLIDAPLLERMLQYRLR